MKEMHELIDEAKKRGHNISAIGGPAPKMLTELKVVYIPTHLLGYRYFNSNHYYVIYEG